ncbi:MAG TPA: TAXI family TRAP transporter solute-binding subunit [Xanthobacteraceae bacterium]|jgi:TRAP-type uncharacterized transport system substrate-binding protein|nr:TAXI family TRAP transporter solute-binding subunit [Xanthobacteraceae bacterium]
MRTLNSGLVCDRNSRLTSIVALILFVFLVNIGLQIPSHAQSVPKSLEEGGPEGALRNKKNQWTIGVAGGLLSGTNMTFSDELAQVLDDGDNLRIIPMVTYGAAQNLDDLLYLRGVDVAITQSDVFEYFRTQRKTPNLEQRVHYILRLPVSEVHILARKDIGSIEDLRGKKVNFGPAGSASSLTGSIVFQRLGVQVEQTLFDNPVALQKVRSGELAALIRVIGRPIDFFAKIPADAGLHLVPIPFSKTFADLYTLGEFKSTEYPTLVPEGKSTDTIAVPTVLAAFNWQKNTDRYRRVQKFVDALFTKFDKFRQPPRHPKWKDVNLAATVPGWTRLNSADEALKKLRLDVQDQQQVASSEFTTFLRNTGTVGANLSQEQREDLFREFLRWREGQRTTRR